MVKRIGCLLLGLWIGAACAQYTSPGGDDWRSLVRQRRVLSGRAARIRSGNK